MSHAAFFHQPSETVRFYVPVGTGQVGASVSRATLHHCFRPGAQDEDPLETFEAFSAELALAVQRRVAQGALEPVMLREFDLRPEQRQK